MRVLGIETSCDETGVGVDGDRGLLAHAVYSQVESRRVRRRSARLASATV